MKLNFIHIPKFRALEGLDVNFSNSHSYSFNKKTKSIKISRNNDCYPFFYGPNITNVSCLLGENGTGKSSIIKLIQEIFYNPGLLQDGLIITEDKKKQTIYHDIENLKIESKSYNVEIKKLSDLNLSNTFLAIVSNLFDPFEIESNLLKDIDSTNFKNLSTTYLYYEAHVLERSSENTITKGVIFENAISKYKAQEFQRMISFFQWANKNKFNFSHVRFPDYIKISFDFKKEGAIFLDSILNFKINESNINETNFIKQVARGALNIDEIYKTKTIYDNENDINVSINNFLGAYINPWSNPSMHKEKNIFYKKYLSFVRLLKKHINNKRIQVIKDEFIIIPINNFTTDELYLIISKYFSLLKKGFYSTIQLSHDPFDLLRLSTGELTLISLLSRIHSLSVRSKQDLLLIIDESELGLHPKWQKEFFSIICTFLEKRFKNRIQLILTTHSPFMISDMVINSIIPLKRRNNMTYVDLEFKNSKKTFGSNIHELLTDSFFLDNGLIGDFAKEKINKVISWCKSKSKKDDFEIQFIIENIGDSLIKAKLAEMYAKKMMSINKVKYLELEIKQLTQQLNKLKKYDKNKEQ